MNKKLLIILIVFLLTGCWNYQELNALAITTAMAIDLTDDGEYEVSILIANSKKSQSTSQESESQTVIYSGVGETITEALKEIDLLNPRQIYISHISIVIISEDIAYEGIADSLDFLLRDSESTKRFQMAIARDTKAKDIIKIVSPLESFPAQSVADNIKVSNESQAKSSSMLYSNFIYLLLEKGIHPVLPSVITVGNVKKGSKDESLQQTVPDASVKLSGMGLFKNDKLVGYANSDESKGINITRNETDQMNLYIKCDGDYTTVEILKLSTKLSISNKDKLKFNVDVKARATIIEDNCKHNLTEEKVISKIEKDAEENLKNLIEKGIKAAKKYKTDIFGFGRLLYKKHPNTFKKYENWDKDGFLEADFKVNTDIELKFKGAAIQNIKGAMDESQKD